jgi:hypothetical protein
MNFQVDLNTLTSYLESLVVTCYNLIPDIQCVKVRLCPYDQHLYCDILYQKNNVIGTYKHYIKKGDIESEVNRMIARHRFMISLD